jgi:cytochrome c-type biogenesis protein CcmH
MIAFIAAACGLSALVLLLLLRPLVFACRTRSSRLTLAGVALAVPLGAGALYGAIGNTDALGGHTAAAAQDPQIQKMVADFAAKMEQNPGDGKGWLMLARSYKVLGRTADAQRAYERAGDFIDGDAQELANYADVVATVAGGKFTDRATQLIDKALKVDANNTMALWLAGSAAYEHGDMPSAVDRWQKLLTLVPPDSDDARELRAAIVQAGGTPPAESGPVAVAAGSGASVAGTVELDPKLQAAPGATVMVIARVPGERVPVAVMRAPASSFPLAFTLDDSVSMSPQSRLSSVAEVEVEARISKTGQAMPQAGDLLSAPQVVKVGAKNVRLKVENVRG